MSCSIQLHITHSDKKNTHKPSRSLLQNLSKTIWTSFIAYVARKPSIDAGRTATIFNKQGIQRAFLEKPAS